MMQTVISATITVLERQYKVRHDDNGVGVAIQSLLLSGRHREIDTCNTLGQISQHGRRRGYGDVLGPTPQANHLLPVFKNESAEEPDS